MLRKIGIVEWGVLLAVAAGANIGCSAGEEPGLANRSGAEPNTSASTSTASAPNTAGRQAGLQAQRDPVRRVAGVSATGLTADEAAENFLQNSVAALGLAADELKPATRKVWLLA